MTDASASANSSGVGEEESLLHLDLPKAPPMRSRPAVSPVNVGKKLVGLEDLCAAFPEIGQGEFFLRIERITPKSYMGTPIAGTLEDLHEKITMSDFRRRYGGGRYSVAVIGPYGTPGPDGQQPLRQLNDVEIGIPGPPASNSLPMTEDSMNQGPYHYTAGRFPVEDARVAVKRIDVEAKEREDQRKILAAASQAPEYVVRALQDQSKTAVDGIRERADAETGALRSQIQLYTTQLAERDAENRNLREQLMIAKSESSEAVRKAEREMERQLKATHEIELRNVQDKLDTEIRHLRDSTSRELTALREQHASALAETHRRHETALSDASRRYQEDMSRRQDEDRKARDLVKEASDARIADLKDQHQRELNQIRTQNATAIEQVRATYENTNKFAESTAAIRVETKEAELVRLRGEISSLEKKVKDLTKDPITYLTETREVASTLLNMVPASDVADATAESGNFDWKREGAKALVSFVQGLPDTVGKAAEAVQNMRAQNQQAQAQAQHAQQMAEQQQYGNFDMAPQAQQQQQQGRRRRRMAPPPGMDGMPPAYMGPVQGAEIPFQQPYAPMPRHQDQPAGPPVPQQVGQPVDPNAPPFGYAGPSANAFQPQHQSVLQQPPTPAPQQPQQPMQISEQQAQAMQAQFEMFIHELDQAIANEMMTAKVFAAAFVAQFGKANAAQVLSQLSADQFLAQLDQTGNGGTITTVEGREYVKDLWAEVARLVKT